MIKISADIAWLLAIKVKVGLQSVAVVAFFVTIEKAKCDERVEKIVSATLGEAGFRSEPVEVAEVPWRVR